MSEDDKVRFNVKMDEKLRDDAKRNTERGELSEEVRSVFRRKAYGIDSEGKPSEIERKKAQLRDVRDSIDKKRRERERINAEISAEETRATRLEERISELEEERDELGQAVDMLENMLHDGDRMWPVRIKNAVDVDLSTANELYQQLQERNAELPEAAFTEPRVEDPVDWTDTVTDNSY
jgi:chromosome segregation ATPase